MTFDFAQARVNMVESQVRTNDVTDHAVQDAMSDFPRERLCAPGKQSLAYAEAATPYAPGWFMMEPRDVSKLMQAVSPKPGEKALAIAAPYAAALLSLIGCHVTARLPEGAGETVSPVLAEHGVAVETGDLARLGEEGPFDLIVCEGGVTRIPQAWLDALAVGGRLAVVERVGPGGKAQLVTRGEDGLPARRELFDSTPPLMPGFAPVEAFAL
ncbi:protein-L-isoaspartate O-methyltransferase [soil metagenome]